MAVCWGPIPHRILWGQPENRLIIEYSQKRKGGGVKRELGIYSAAKSIDVRY